MNSLEHIPPATLQEAIELGERLPLTELAARAARIRDLGYGRNLSYSPKVFIPLTELCRDVCHYCTFAKNPRDLRSPFLELNEVVRIAKEGEKAGCKEALFTLGEKPELRYATARSWLNERGYRSTVEYLEAAASEVLRTTHLIPHLNAGTLTRAELKRLRAVSASMGIMLESSSKRLTEVGGAHFGSPDKTPYRRLSTLVRAGREGVPMTTGLLVGIGESRRDRMKDLLDIQSVHRRYGNIQEVIIQNFRAKPGTLMAASEEPNTEELCWTIAMARLILPSEVSLQAPPNLSPGALEPLIAAGINDWGGISPVTPDHVNPEAPWPTLEELGLQCQSANKNLIARLTVYPRYLGIHGASDKARWLSPNIRGRCLALVDSEGALRDSIWHAGKSALESTDRSSIEPAGFEPAKAWPLWGELKVDRRLQSLLDACLVGHRPSQAECQYLFAARGGDFRAVIDAADRLREQQVGDVVTFVVNRNINYTNVCQYSCSFCAFSKRTSRSADQERPYDIDGAELLRRAREAVEHGATELCLQGGIHPAYTGHTYLTILRNISSALPDLHLHAFSPLEVQHGAQTLQLSLHDYLLELKDAGLRTLPGTAAEILVDRVRDQICPDKLTSDEWLEVMRVAHFLGLRTTATMMFGHVDDAADWSAHLVKLRDLQRETGGFTEFVPLPFVAREAPMAKRGQSRHGPTLREAYLVHAVARLALGWDFTNIQTSWVKMGRPHALACLSAGANDLGGSLINESITRAAGASHGQWWPASSMADAIEANGKTPRIRLTDYQSAKPASVALAFRSDHQIAEPINLIAQRDARSKAFFGGGT
ncbi:MAG: 5-amino-6-(D-ribitylamino)uracil--L-tyrosine 4-hydroxyphenyl transferase CofH [Pseudomonadota bacterium]